MCLFSFLFLLKMAQPESLEHQGDVVATMAANVDSDVPEGGLSSLYHPSPPGHCHAVAHLQGGGNYLILRILTVDLLHIKRFPRSSSF